MLGIEVLAQPPQAEDRPPVEGFSAWYDASDARSIQFSAGNLVRQWQDKTVAARHMVQAASTGMPFAGSWSQNGRNVLWNLVRGAYMTSPSPGFGLSGQPWTAFVAAMHGRGTNQQTTWTAYSGGTELGRNYKTSGGAIAIYANGGFTTIPWELRRPRVVSSVFNGASSQQVVDGRTKTTGSVSNIGGSPVGGTVFAFGGTEFFEGWIGELLVYTRRLTDSEIQRVEAYLMRKWGLA